MTTNDAKLTDGLNAFCRRLIEGHPSLPTGQSWEAIDLDRQNKIKTNFLGPLHAAAEVLTKPDVVTTAEELDALPSWSVVLVSKEHAGTAAAEKWPSGWRIPLRSGTFAATDLLRGSVVTVLHVGGSR